MRLKEEDDPEGSGFRIRSPMLRLDVKIAMFAVRPESYITTVGLQIFLLYPNCFKILTL